MSELNPLNVTYTDDPRVLIEQSAEDYSRHVVPLSARTNRWSLAMASWSVLSAMFYLYISVAVAQSVGSKNAIVGIVLSALFYGGINYVISQRSIKNGLTVALLSRGIFGGAGAIISSLLFAVTATYYAVFEGSIIAVAFQQYFAPESDMRWWYLLVVLYALPLVMGSVQVWLDKLNGALLPLYIVGLVLVIFMAGNKYGFTTSFLSIPASSDSVVPGWMWAFIVYMGICVNMMVTAEFSRFGKPADAKFHGLITFGPVFYLALFVVNGLAGVFIMDTVFPGLKASERGIAEAILNASGFLGLIFILISQTRINTANYYVASLNFAGFAARGLRLYWPRWVWVLFVGCCVYLLMLTNVFSYLLKALAWQGVAVTSWVAILMTHYALNRDAKHGLEFRPGRVKAFMPGAWAMIISTVVGITIVEGGTKGSWYVETAPILISGLAAFSYWMIIKFVDGGLISRSSDPRDDVFDVWRAHIECHVCNRSYSAIEMDRDPSAGQQAICAGCAEGNYVFLQSARQEGSGVRASPAQAN
ncbi:cytosine permease [Pseudomonas sp. FP1742]|uniref:purine-cytosine permease family protein n=1 Tax=Pseudomonas sp. FP1742 TaxID=2954079 RepID=UPI0027360A5E|nr:allantoin permease [Pseudomonas sp. FP1742]WLG48526.1 allantoin permease [Pseudomonas sp. FP1742]